MNLKIRPDPEQVLKKIQAEEAEEKRGSLKIFLGAAAGVGKTYAMLQAAADLLNDKVDVIIGYVETHGRAETIAKIPPNIEQIPPLEINYKNTIRHEFNLDAALTRKPQVIIVDELAHSNIPGSRNAKRYQDVLELINAGIDVYTALNIQHIESLNNIVEKITEVQIHETVPDQIIDIADEVVLIDLTPDELQERLQEGKIYNIEKATHALNNFFRKGNLIALRELSLRKTAQKVDKQVLEYRNEKEIDALWPNNDQLLVILEPGYSSEKIIRAAKNMFEKGFSSWYVVYFENASFTEKSIRDKQHMLDLLEFAKQLGAITTKLTGTDQARAIVEFAKTNNINNVMLAQYRLPYYYKIFGKSLSERISELSPELNINLVSDEVTYANQKLPSYERRKKFNYPKFVRKVILTAITFTVLGIACQPLIGHIDNQNILMLYLATMLLFNRSRGKISSFTSALICTASYDFFFVDPRFSFAISDTQYVLTFMSMATIGILFSVINGNLRYQVNELHKARLQYDLFADLCRDLAEALVLQQVLDTIPKYFSLMFEAQYMLLIPNLEEDLELKTNINFPNYDLHVASWVFINGQNAGLNTNTFASSDLVYMPINSQLRVRGVIIIKPNDETEFFLPAEQELLSRFISQIALTLERIHFAQIVLQTELALAKV